MSINRQCSVFLSPYTNTRSLLGSLAFTMCKVIGRNVVKHLETWSFMGNGVEGREVRRICQLYHNITEQSQCSNLIFQGISDMVLLLTFTRTHAIAFLKQLKKTTPPKGKKVVTLSQMFNFHYLANVNRKEQTSKKEIDLNFLANACPKH